MVKLEAAIKTNNFSSELQKAGLNILYTSWWLKTLISRELKGLKLTAEQYNVLRILKGKHPEKMCIRDIAGRMIEKNSNIPRIIDRLVLKNLVERGTSEIDKRETSVSLTSTGLDILLKANRQIDTLFSTSLRLQERDAQHLNELLELFRIQE